MGNGTPALPSQQRPTVLGGRQWNALSISVAEDPKTEPNSLRHGFAGSRFIWVGLRPKVLGGGLKRGFDIAAASVSIILLLPLFCLIALATKLSDGGPVFFRHRRIGLNGSSFGCLKFRTMVTDADQVLQRHLAQDQDAAREWAELHKLKKDPRVTPLGAAMRKTSVDELPQLLNILRGDMSFVGPRPIVSTEVSKYGDCIEHYLSTRPGLTGPWQVSGRNDVDYATRVALDRQYVEQWSFWRDLTIIAGTVRVVVTSRGCY
jgi:exopolysaccharide production protein ExoY